MRFSLEDDWVNVEALQVTSRGTEVSGQGYVGISTGELKDARVVAATLPEGGLPISVDLAESAELTYAGFITITENTPSARTWAVYSARDLAGNRSTVIDEGQSILIDTDGPAAGRLIVLPLAPIQNDEQNPVTLLVTVGLNEKSDPAAGIDAPTVRRRRIRQSRPAPDQQPLGHQPLQPVPTGASDPALCKSATAGDCQPMVL